MSTRSYYEILNVRPSASFDEIKANYKKLILQCHPDKFHGIGTTEATTAANFNATVAADPIAATSVTVAKSNDSKFVEINKAWNTLKEPSQRKLYDAEFIANKFQTHSNIFARLKLADLDVVVVNNNNVDDEDYAVNADDSTKLYTYDCRCGGQYVVDESADKEIFDTRSSDNVDVLVECSECSLAIILNG